MNRRLWTVVIVVLLGAVTGAAIVQLLPSDDGAAAPAVKPSSDARRADAIVHAAMLSPSEIPGSGWQITGSDRGDFRPYPKIDSCNKVQAYVDAGRQGRTAMASRSIAKQLDDSGDSIGFTMGMKIYDSSDRLPRMFAQYKGLLADGIEKACFDATYAEAIVSSATVAPVGAVPNGGTSFAVETEDKRRLHKDHYEELSWSSGNALLSLVFTGPPDLVTAELVNTTIQTLTTAAQDAQAGKRAAR